MKKAIAFLMIALFLMMTATVTLGEDKDIPLTEPKLDPAVDLLTAFKLRQSTRSFTDKKVSIADLSTVLWAADGINRADGKRTAPAAMGKYVVTIYVLSDQGVFCYQPKKQLLKFISAKKLKTKVGNQADIGTACYVLLLTARLNGYPVFIGQKERLAFAHATAGCIGENVYLMANALKLGTRLVASIKTQEVKTGLALEKDETPLYIMPLGYPKE
jgi:nitroreductase